MEERRFRLVPVEEPWIAALLGDLTDEARMPSPVTGLAPSEKTIREWDRSFKDAGGWCWIFLSDEGRPLAMVGATAPCECGYTSGLVTRSLCADRRLAVQAMREWRARLAPGIWHTAFRTDQATMTMHRAAGWAFAATALGCTAMTMEIHRWDSTPYPGF